MRVLAHVAFARITRTRRGWLPLIAWGALAVAFAIVTRTVGRSGGASHLLVGPFAQIVLPLSAYGIVSAVFAGTGMRASQRGIVALGARPSRAALASVIVATATSALAVGVMAVLVCSIAHGPADAPLVRDAPITFGVAALSGAAYAAFFCVGSGIGRGAMRSVFLVLDLLLGVSSGVGSVFVPRGHVTSLFGGGACFELSRRASSGCLFAILAISLLATVLLGRGRR